MASSSVDYSFVRSIDMSTFIYLLPKRGELWFDYNGDYYLEDGFSFLTTFGYFASI